MLIVSYVSDVVIWTHKHVRLVMVTMTADIWMDVWMNEVVDLNSTQGKWTTSPNEYPRHCTYTRYYDIIRNTRNISAEIIKGTRKFFSLALVNGRIPGKWWTEKGRNGMIS